MSPGGTVQTKCNEIYLKINDSNKEKPLLLSVTRKISQGE